jgi:pimeloyl-ACP methyl ester carboxylesterase
LEIGMSASGGDYDEFGFFADIAAEWDLPWQGPPKVQRREIALAPAQFVSALLWGEASPEIVFVHGGAQNAHTWDAVALALGRPAVAFDLPGHGHSTWRADRNYGPAKNAEALATGIEALAPNAQVVVGMSLGGATTLQLAARHPELVKKAVIVDVTPQVSGTFRSMTREDRGSLALLNGAPTYESFEAMAAITIAMSPNRSPESVRRGVRHNSKRLPDGRWCWRHDLMGGMTDATTDFSALWDDVSRIKCPMMLVRGGLSKFVTDAGEAEMRRRQPSLRVEVVAGAGHAVQSDQPLELVRLIEEFAFGA